MANGGPSGAPTGSKPAPSAGSSASASARPRPPPIQIPARARTWAEVTRAYRPPLTALPRRPSPARRPSPRSTVLFPTLPRRRRPSPRSDDGWSTPSSTSSWSSNASIKSTPSPHTPDSIRYTPGGTPRDPSPPTSPPIPPPKSLRPWDCVVKYERRRKNQARLKFLTNPDGPDLSDIYP